MLSSMFERTAMGELPTFVGKENVSFVRPLSLSEPGLVIDARDGTSACPCCNRQIDEGRQTLDEPSSGSRNMRRSLMDDALSSDDEDCDENESLPGVLHSGIEYRPKKILVEGWVHKKGTGKDIFGSRAWKPRYCRLVLARVEGHDFDMPLLLVYWLPYSETPSTVISLDSTVVLPVDRPDHSWNKHCFNVIHAKGDTNETTRSFTVAQKGRDAWVLAINQALLHHEKQKSRAKNEAAMCRTPRSTLVNTGIMMGESFVEASLSPTRAISAPLSPRSSERRPLPLGPQSDILLGESLLPW